jgi:asparagine synthase (glutamine-hydrolysing)
MSILLGVLKERGALASEQELRQLSYATERYATERSVFSVHGRLGVCFQPYISHERSRMETGSRRDVCGNVVSFDGRLDNFQELAEMLGLDATQSSDSMIVLAAFLRWGEECFSRFTGDWALSLWDVRKQRLFLALDHAGTRSLYFSRTGSRVQWATFLDTFVRRGAELPLSKEYAAAYLSRSAVRDLTPYEDIRSVLPGHYAVVGGESIVQRPHWSAVIQTSVRYQADAEYDEHFLSLFQQAIARRTGPGEPTLAQLSGGMDSTSIVCMSDSLRRSTNPDAEILDTISFFDDSETSLDERRYFSVTEARRGKVGTHLDTAFSHRTFDPPFSEIGRYQAPGCDSFSVELEQSLFHSVWEKGYRSILSGIGGDEVLGGIPNGLPELADYLVSGKLITLLRQAVAWSLPNRCPLVETLSNTAGYTMRLYTQNNPKSRLSPSWLSKELRSVHTNNAQRADMVPERIGIAPHRLENAFTWWQIMETLPHLSPQILFRPEHRYPMLDKDLVEYLFSIPPEQLVRPGRRRYMMRRALRNIVPAEILERRRKAFQLRAPMSAIRVSHTKLFQLFSHSRLAASGFIDAEAFRAALKITADGNAESYQAILRTIAYELWLQARADGGAVTNTTNARPHAHPSLAMPSRPSSSVRIEPYTFESNGN